MSISHLSFSAGITLFLCVGRYLWQICVWYPRCSMQTGQWTTIRFVLSHLFQLLVNFGIGHWLEMSGIDIAGCTNCCHLFWVVYVSLGSAWSPECAWGKVFIDLVLSVWTLQVLEILRRELSNACNNHTHDWKPFPSKMKPFDGPDEIIILFHVSSVLFRCVGF